MTGLVSIPGRICGFALLLSILLPLAVPLSAQEPNVHIQVDTAVVSVGDRISLTVTVDHSPGSQVIWPDSLNLAPFEVLGARAMPPEREEGLARSTLVLTLAAFELGDLEIPSFEVGIHEPGGETTVLATERYGIQVLSVGLDEGGDIRDIKGPLGIPVNLLPLLLVLLVVALAGVSAWALFRRYRRRDPELRDTAPAAPWRPPQEIALEALDRLEKSQLLEKGEIKEYHIRVSEVLRTYVEGRFQVRALEMTTGDILPGLRSKGLDGRTLEGFQELLDQCDMVKFAKYRPEAAAAQSVLALGRRLVEDTVPTRNPAVSVPASEEDPGIRGAED